MKRKFLITLLSLVCALCLPLGLAACDMTDSSGGEHVHSYQWKDNGDGTHRQHCSLSGCDEPDVNTESHVWGTDNKCTKCKAVKSGGTENPSAHSHVWSTDWANNDTHHWHNCTADGCNVTDNAQKDGYAAHDFTNGNCVCGKEKPVAPHAHVWSTDWANNDTHHWHNCTADGCDVTDNAQKDGYAAHDFTNGNCVCGKIAPHVHVWSTEWETTATRHWHNCTAEGCPVTSILEKDGYAAHDFSNNGICICGKSRELNYVLNSDNESYSVKGIGSIISANVEIPAEYNGKPVTDIKNYAFENCGIKNLTIGRNITSIGKGVFDGCGIMESVTVDENNTQYASQDGILYNKAKTEFKHIPAELKGEVTIPDGVTSIGEQAFRGRKITSITIGSGVTGIGESAFYDSKQLTSVTLPDGIKGIGNSAFDGCNKLQFTEYENACYLGNSANPYLRW